MTKPQSGNTDHRLAEPEKDSAVVRSETDTLSDHSDVSIPEETAEPVDGETEALEDTGDAEDNTSGDSETQQGADDVEPVQARRRINRSHVLPYALLPALALLLAIAGGYVKWQDVSARSSAMARIESVAAAKDATIALLSYQPATAEKELGAARDRLTGTFKDSYTQLIHDVVIPAAKQKHISAVATVPAVASVSATPSTAVALLFVNQTIVVGTEAPSDTASSVRVTLNKVGDRWLISEFDPI